MAIASLEYCKTTVYIPNLDFVTFVAKVQKAKTRKDKNYFILRTTIPKDVAKKIDVEPGDYLLFKAKKAQWYHMLDWEKMENTRRMLPVEIRERIIMDGVCVQGIETTPPVGATNLSAPTQQMIDVQTG